VQLFASASAKLARTSKYGTFKKKASYTNEVELEVCCAD
jgi:hypothetical protein